MEINSYIKPDQVAHELRKLNIPRKFVPYSITPIFSHQYSIFVSTRECAKTTYTLILGLILYKLYGTTTEYIRCDEDQTRRAVIEPLYNTIKANNYVARIFNNNWNDIEYSQTKKSFTLIRRDVEGSIVARDQKSFCFVHSNEKWQSLKSGYNSPKGDFIVFDEFFDSHRATYYQIVELWNNISTIGRVFEDERQPNVHVVMLGNNTDFNSFWWDELNITDKIRQVKSFGDSFDETTEDGTTIYFKSIDLSEERKEKIRKKKIPFFGFNTKKAAQFTGSAIWSTKDYQHIDDIEILAPENKIDDHMVIFHRDRYIRLNLFYDKNRQYFVFLHFIRKPKLKDYVIYTLQPRESNEVYGVGEYSDCKQAFESMKKLRRLKMENRWYYENNTIGSIIDDYFKNIT